MRKFLVLIALALIGCDEPAPISCPVPQQAVVSCPQPVKQSNDEACPRGYNFYHKLAPGEDFQCQKGYRQHQVWKDVGLGFSAAPSDMVECICRNWHDR